MTDIEPALWSAWAKVWPKLRDDPVELAKRLRRRRGRTALRPPRACCLALRASDRRLTPMNAPIVPEWAPDELAPHDVTIDRRLLDDLCPPVHVDAPGGEPHRLVARKLGLAPGRLRNLRRNPAVTVRYVRGGGPGGLRGKPRPLLCTPEPLDPSARGNLGPDRVWSGVWAHLHLRVDPAFRQVVRREPFFKDVRPGDRHFRGWLWACPGCGRRVRTLYMPVHLEDWGHYVGLRLGDADEVQPPPETFACWQCHGVLAFSRVNPAKAWNEVVLFLTAGLMYGHEVEMPPWFTPARRNRFAPRAYKAPRRDELTRFLVSTTLPLRDVARRMGLSPSHIYPAAHAIYKRHGVHSRPQLRALLAPAEKEEPQMNTDEHG